MDTAQAITAAIVAIGIFAVLLGIVALMWQINSQSSRLETKMEEQGKELRAEIAEQGKRVAQSELDQARMNGVNSVLLRHTHTHETLGDAD